MEEEESESTCVRKRVYLYEHVCICLCVCMCEGKDSLNYGLVVSKKQVIYRVDSHFAAWAFREI